MRSQTISLALLTLLTGACSTPAIRNDAFATNSGFIRQIVAGTDFSHLVYINEKGITEKGVAGKRTKNPTWHIYIEGDGVPWIRQNIVATDPTPLKPLMLSLMTQDSRPAIYLGRPCYNGMNKDPSCNPWLWTYGRYSRQVVESMRTVLNTLVRENAIDSMTLIGHSGGGTLAMLLAEKVPQVRKVVTLGGNLDIEAWTSKHGFTTLQDSLNPARRAPLPRQIKQLHFVGADDKNVPQEMLKAAVKQQRNADIFVLDEITHKRGWNSYWTEILKKIALSGDKS